jgi:hypothetical protein
MSLISSQALTFDYLRQPWVYDPDLGPIVAPRTEKSGEGAYRYTFKEGSWFVEKNASPTPESEFRARFDANIQRTVHAAFANDDEFFDEDSSSSSPPAPSSSPPSQSVAPIERSLPKVVRRPLPRSHTPRLDKNAHYDALLKEQGCVIAPKLRESNGRMDMHIYDPQSGKQFRSRLEAMRFFSISV